MSSYTTPDLTFSFVWKFNLRIFWRWRRQVPPKYRWPSTWMFRVGSQQTTWKSLQTLMVIIFLGVGITGQWPVLLMFWINIQLLSSGLNTGHYHTCNMFLQYVSITVQVHMSTENLSSSSSMKHSLKA